MFYEPQSLCSDFIFKRVTEKIRNKKKNKMQIIIKMQWNLYPSLMIKFSYATLTKSYTEEEELIATSVPLPLMTCIYLHESFWPKYKRFLTNKSPPWKSVCLNLQKKLKNTCVTCVQFFSDCGKADNTLKSPHIQSFGQKHKHACNIFRFKKSNLKPS